MRNQSSIAINQSVKKSHVGSHQNPIILHELVSQISLFYNYEEVILAYVKSRENRRLFENQSGIKIV